MNPKEKQNTPEELQTRPTELRGEDVVEEIRRVRATLLQEAGGDLDALFDLVAREAAQIRSSRRKSA